MAKKETTQTQLLPLEEQQFAQTFPYSVVDTIKVIAYNSQGLPGCLTQSLVNEKGEFDVKNSHTTNGIEQVKLLTPIQVKQIFKILTAKDASSMQVADCYLPRHAIVFYKSQKVIAFIEFCFECNQYCMYPTKNTFSYIGQNKMEQIKYFLGELGGIKYL